MNAFNITFLKVFANGYTNIMFFAFLEKTAAVMLS